MRSLFQHLILKAFSSLSRERKKRQPSEGPASALPWTKDVGLEKPSGDPLGSPNEVIHLLLPSLTTISLGIYNQLAII